MWTPRTGIMLPWRVSHADCELVNSKSGIHIIVSCSWVVHNFHGHTRQPRPFFELSFVLLIVAAGVSLPSFPVFLAFPPALTFVGALAMGLIGSYVIRHYLWLCPWLPTLPWKLHSLCQIISGDVFSLLPFVCLLLPDAKVFPCLWLSALKRISFCLCVLSLE